MVNRFKDLFSSLTPNIFHTCILCGARQSGQIDLCTACQQELPTLSGGCLRCSLPIADSDIADPNNPQCGQCLQQPPPFQQTIASWTYQPPIAQLISRFKYQRQLSIGRSLSMLLAENIAANYSPESLPDVITPTPLHRWRLLRRGFNQSEHICQVLSKKLGIPVNSLVKRQRPTPAQQSLTASQRRRNLKGAFKVSRDVKGLSIALVDDVLTTGATATEISQCLLKAGAKEVHLWCLARTPH